MPDKPTHPPSLEKLRKDRTRCELSLRRIIRQEIERTGAKGDEVLDVIDRRYPEIKEMGLNK